MKIITVALMAMIVLSIFSVGVMAKMAKTHPGPAPNAGDGIPDGPGWGEEGNPPHPANGNTGRGPAPNAGDGIPDGPGW